MRNDTGGGAQRRQGGPTAAGLTRGLGALLALALMGLLRTPAAAADLERLLYRNPGLTVDLGVGLWATPLPMDYDSDGDLDLVVDCTDVPYNGTYWFENPGPASDPMPVFRPGRRIGPGLPNGQASYPDGPLATPRILIPGYEYVGFRGAQFAKREPLTVPPPVLPRRVRADQWRYVDFDGDGRLDLVNGVGDWADYGWDNAFNERGEWTRGPLHGYVYLLRNRGTAAAPDYAPPERLTAAGTAIDVYGMPSPSLADFDGDGDLDLVCGEFRDSLTYFRNTGTRQAPAFAPGRPLLAPDGTPLAMDLCMINPVALDWDGDGAPDLVVGQEDGRVAWLENTGQVIDGVPRFRPPRFFRQQADELKFGILVTPVSTDWDGDGDEDLVAGNSAGYLAFIENLGGDPPRWAEPKLLSADGQVIRIMAGPNGSIQGPCEAKWGYTTLAVGDWDGDGLPDIVGNSIWGKVVWWRNTGTRRQPALAAARPVEVEWPPEALADPPRPAWNWWRPQGRELATQWRTKPVTMDVNRDGLSDLVMLDHEGYLACFERRRDGDRLLLLPPQRLFLAAATPGATPEPLRLNAGTAGKSGRRQFCFADWDGDGRLDLLADGRNVDFLRNVGAPGQWVFANTGALAERRLAGHTPSPTVVDWDHDGRPDLLVGGEDGYLYYLRNPGPPAPRPRQGPARHLVAAWDFEPGRGGPLADKATAGTARDDLEALGTARAEAGVGTVPDVDGAAFQAASSADLEQTDELTVWARVRVGAHPKGFACLVDKRRFRDPEERSYGLYVPPGPGGPQTCTVGGQVSASGSSAATVACANGRPLLPVGEWRPVAMVVARSAGGALAVSWYVARTAAPAAAADLEPVADPVSDPALIRLFPAHQPLTLGRDINLKAVGGQVDLDEVRLYDRALDPAELAAIRPGELSAP